MDKDYAAKLKAIDESISAQIATKIAYFATPFTQIQHQLTHFQHRMDQYKTACLLDKHRLLLRVIRLHAQNNKALCSEQQGFVL